MVSRVQDKNFKVIYWAMIFLTIGFIASPTLVSLYHILIIIPAIIIYKKGLYPVKIAASSWCLIVLFVWGIISTIYNLDTVIKPRKSFDDLKFYLFGFFLIVPLKYFFDRVSDFQKKKLLKILLITISAAFVVGIVKAYLGFDLVKFRSGDFMNRSGGFTNYMRYGYSHAFIALLAMGMLVNFEKIKAYISKRSVIAVISLCLLAVLLAKTRGAILALMVGVPFLFLKYQPKIAKAVIAAGCIFVSIIVYISFFSNSTNRFLDIKDGSNTKRMSQFYSAVKSVQEKPIMGLGSDQFSYNVPRLKEKYDIWSKEYTGHSHNIFLEHAANFGLPGLLLFLGFLLFWFKEMIGLKNDLGWCVASYIVAFTVSGQVENLFDNTNSHLLFFIYSFSQIDSKVYKNA